MAVVVEEAAAATAHCHNNNNSSGKAIPLDLPNLASGEKVGNNNSPSSLKQQQQQRHKATTIHKHSMAPGNGVSCASAKSTAVQVVAGFSALGSPRSRQRDRSHAAAQQQCSEPCKATSLVKSGVIKVFLSCVRAFLLCVCVLCARQLVAPDYFDQLRLSCCCVAVRPLAAWRRSAVC